MKLRGLLHRQVGRLIDGGGVDASVANPLVDAVSNELARPLRRARRWRCLSSLSEYRIPLRMDPAPEVSSPHALRCATSSRCRAIRASTTSSLLSPSAITCLTNDHLAEWSPNSFITRSRRAVGLRSPRRASSIMRSATTSRAAFAPSVRFRALQTSSKAYDKDWISFGSNTELVLEKGTDGTHGASPVPGGAPADVAGFAR